MTRLAGCLSIGPVRFRLFGKNLPKEMYTGWAYRDFFSCAEPHAEAPVELTVRIDRGECDMPPGEPLYESGGNWAVWADEGGWTFCARYAKRERPFYSCRLSRALDEAELRIDGDFGDTPLCYPIDQVLAWILLGRCDGAMLHSAFVVRNESAFLFAGRSGAGKSTLSALCRAEGWRVMNDDRAALLNRDGRVFAAGTPWHGSGCFAEAGEAELGGIFMLEQSKTERIERLDDRAARMALIDIASIPWFEPEWSQRTLDALDRAARVVPVYRFHFTKSPAAARALALLQDARQAG